MRLSVSSFPLAMTTPQRCSGLFIGYVFPSAAGLLHEHQRDQDATSLSSGVGDFRRQRHRLAGGDAHADVVRSSVSGHNAFGSPFHDGSASTDTAGRIGQTAIGYSDRIRHGSTRMRDRAAFRAGPPGTEGGEDVPALSFYRRAARRQIVVSHVHNGLRCITTFRLVSASLRKPCKWATGGRGQAWPLTSEPAGSPCTCDGQWWG